MSCCCERKEIVTVIGNNALATPTANPVTLTVDKPLTDIGANTCFTLRIPKAFLKNVNANPVQLTDGTTTLALVTCCTDTLRYDSLVCKADQKPSRACLRLTASRRTNPAHVTINDCLPVSSYSAPAPTPAPAGGTENG